MSKYQYTAIGFTLIIIMLVIIGVSSIFMLRDIAKDVENIYKHPFAVSNAAKNIDFHLVSMQRQMKDLVLADNAGQQAKAAYEVRKHERAVLVNFKIISSRYLGEESQINQTYNTFLNWKPIREEIIRLVKESRIKEAADLTKGREAEHVKNLNKEVNILVSFALNKAKEFRTRAQENEHRATILLTSLSIFTVFAAFIIAFYVLRNLIKTTKDRAQQESLINQHIMIASLDLDGNVLDASNALCQFLRYEKQNLLGQKSNFFDNSTDHQHLQDHIWQTIMAGKSWSGEIKYIDAIGIPNWANATIIPNFEGDDQIVGFTNILTDTTSKKLSITDNLTSLSNRRQYEETITHEMRLSKRSGTTLTLAIADIDFFKNYNDHYGHPMGDKVLVKVAEQMTASLKRPNDYVFRVGGEEFAFIFSNLNAQESEVFLNDIRQAIEDLDIIHEHSAVSEHVTISIGAQIISPQSQASEEEAYILADKALYIAKEKRNSVVVTS